MDWSSETRNATLFTCSEEKWTKNGLKEATCIDAAYVCNGLIECPNGEEEVPYLLGMVMRMRIHVHMRQKSIKHVSKMDQNGNFICYLAHGHPEYLLCLSCLERAGLGTWSEKKAG